MTRWTVLAAFQAHLLDLTTFLVAARLYGVGDELNPFARFVYESAGPAGAVAWKLGFTVLFLIIASRLMHGGIRSGLVVVFTLVGMTGFAFNALYLLRALSAT